MTEMEKVQAIRRARDRREIAKMRIKELVQKWRDINSKATIKREKFSEEDTATKFIRPMFEALGWNFGNIDEVREEVTLPDSARRQLLDCVLYVRGTPFAVVEYKPLVGSGPIDTDYNFEYVIEAAGKLGAKYAVVTRFSETKIITLDNLAEQRFEVQAKSDYEERFDELWNTLSKESAIKT